MTQVEKLVRALGNEDDPIDMEIAIHDFVIAESEGEFE